MRSVLSDVLGIDSTEVMPFIFFTLYALFLIFVLGYFGSGFYFRTWFHGILFSLFAILKILFVYYTFRINSSTT